MDGASQRRLAKVHPELAKRVAKTLDALAAAGLDVRVVQGLRSYEEQDTLYQQGRTRKGPKVTNARGGYSNHNFGLAVDLCPFSDGEPDWNNARGFGLIGAAGKSQGLEWGGDWVSFPDRPHLQLKTGLDIARCRGIFSVSGLAGVWAAADKHLRPDFGTLPSATPDQGGELVLEIPAVPESAPSPEPATTPPVVEVEQVVAAPKGEGEVEKEVSGIKASTAGAVTFITTSLGGVFSFLSGHGWQIVVGLAIFGGLFVVARFWFANLEKQRAANEREADKKRTHEIQMATLNSAINPELNTVRMVPQPLQQDGTATAAGE